MSVATVTTRGYGSFGSATLVVTRGYTIGAAAAATDDGPTLHVTARQGRTLSVTARQGRTLSVTARI